MDIRDLSLADSATIEQWFTLIKTVQAHDIPNFPEASREHWISGLAHPWPGNREEYAVALDDGKVIGAYRLGLPTLDNLRNADLDIWVSPARRRGGIGRALYSEAVARARANGRTTIVGHAAETYPGTGVVHDGAGNGFASAMGATRVHDEVRRRWDLGTVADEVLRDQLRAAWAHADGYELVTWRDVAPAAIVADIAYLEGRLLTDAPMGGLAWEPEKFDADRVRAGEAAAAARKRRQFATGVLHAATGRLVAYTVIAFDHGTDWHGWQHITIADPEHRGHRLGAIVKLENLRFARAEVPELRALDTWNAAVNTHMIAINEAMGFRPMDNWISWQQEI